MPGVNRPQTFTDVIAALTGQNASAADTSVSGIGVYAEADDGMTLGDTWTSTVPTTAATWDNGLWGQFTWG